MEIAIVGIPRSGKTTIFNALTRGEAQTGKYSQSALAPNIGVVKVPDPRLDGLKGILKPKRTVPAEVTYLDVPMPPKPAEGLGGQYLNLVSKADALAHVVRFFKDETVPHPEGSIDPDRDIETMNLELQFSDLGVIERRLLRLKDSLKGAKLQERDNILREEETLTNVRSVLEEDGSMREMAFSQQEAKLLDNFQFLTAKPVLMLLNIGEDQLEEKTEIESQYGARYRRERSDVAALCGQVEMELAQLSRDEAAEFRLAMGISESGVDRVIRLCYKLLGLVSFFTVVSDEVRAWTVPENTSAQNAAGKIHSDMERGFIRAEVTRYEDLVKCGSLAEARKRGLVHVEGKNYVVQDGDIMTILFNV